MSWLRTACWCLANVRLSCPCCWLFLSPLSAFLLCAWHTFSLLKARMCCLNGCPAALLVADVIAPSVCFSIKLLHPQVPMRSYYQIYRLKRKIMSIQAILFDFCLAHALCLHAIDENRKIHIWIFTLIFICANLVKGISLMLLKLSCGVSCFSLQTRQRTVLCIWFRGLNYCLALFLCNIDFMENMVFVTFTIFSTNFIFG